MIQFTFIISRQKKLSNQPHFIHDISKDYYLKSNVLKHHHQSILESLNIILEKH